MRAHGRSAVHQPVHLASYHAAAQQLIARADHDLACLGPDGDHEHRLAVPAWQTAALADREAGVAIVAAHHATVGGDEVAWRKGGRIGAEVARDDLRVIAVGNEADVLALRLLRHDAESQLARELARLFLGELADGEEHPPYDGAVYSPEEVALVLRAVAPAMQLAIHRARVMPSGDVPRVERVGLAQEVAELREGIAAHARDRRATGGVLAHEIADDVAAECALEVEHVVRNADARAHAARVIYGVERAAGTIGDIVAVAEELHRSADDVVPLPREHGCRHGGVDPSGHRYQNPFAHAAQLATPERRRALVMRAGKSEATRSTPSGVVSGPRLMRTAATASSRGTPIAMSTCDGSTLPL